MERGIPIPVSNWTLDNLKLVFMTVCGKLVPFRLKKLRSYNYQWITEWLEKHDQRDARRYIEDLVACEDVFIFSSS